MSASAQDDRELLGSSITLPFSGRVVKRRFLKSAMTERLCAWSEDDIPSRGKISDAYIQLYHEWGAGGFGVIVLGNLPIHPEHLEARGNAGIYREANWKPTEAFKPAIKAAQVDGALVIGQLTAGGRQVPENVQMHPISPSGGDAFDAIGMHFQKSREMTVEEIDDFTTRWAEAAKVLYDAGADGCQLHAAHGYLLSQFLSPLHNRRTDKYAGNTFEGRSRIVFEILDKIDQAVPDKKFIRSIKINSQDFATGGFEVDDCKKMVEKLEEAGVDIIELSGGSYQSLAFEHKKESTKKRESFFIEFADMIRPALKKSVLAVTGGFRTRGPMAKAIREKSCDIIGVARPVTQHPRLPAQIVSGELDGAIENKVSPQLQTPASVLQIHALGEGRPVLQYDNADDCAEVERQITKQDPPKPQGNYPSM